MKNRPVPPAVAAALIVAAVSVTVVCEMTALQAKERRDHPDGAQTREACLRCHSGPAWIEKIAEKEGKKTTDRLFVDDPPSGWGGTLVVHKFPTSDVHGKGGTTYPGK